MIDLELEIMENMIDRLIIEDSIILFGEEYEIYEESTMAPIDVIKWISITLLLLALLRQIKKYYEEKAEKDSKLKMMETEKKMQKHYQKKYNQKVNELEIEKEQLQKKETYLKNKNKELKSREEELQKGERKPIKEPKKNKTPQKKKETSQKIKKTENYGKNLLSELKSIKKMPNGTEKQKRANQAKGKVDILHKAVTHLSKNTPVYNKVKNIKEKISK